MANDNTDLQSLPQVAQSTTPITTAKAVAATGDYGYVTIAEGKEIAVTDDGIGGEHPYDQPNDPHTLDSAGKPKGKTTDKYIPAQAWVQPNGDHAEVVITPGRVVLANLRSIRIAHKLATGELVRVGQDGKAL